jgi:hypothetical protein
MYFNLIKIFFTVLGFELRVLHLQHCYHLSHISSPYFKKISLNLSIQETEAGGSQVQSQPGLHGKTLSQKRKKERKEGRKEGERKRKQCSSCVEKTGGLYLSLSSSIGSFSSGSETLLYPEVCLKIDQFFKKQNKTKE